MKITKGDTALAGATRTERCTMTRIPVHSVDSAPEGSRDALMALEAQFGKVLNIRGAMARALTETSAVVRAQVGA